MILQMSPTEDTRSLVGPVRLPLQHSCDPAEAVSPPLPSRAHGGLDPLFPTGFSQHSLV